MDLNRIRPDKTWIGPVLLFALIMIGVMLGMEYLLAKLGATSPADGRTVFERPDFQDPEWDAVSYDEAQGCYPFVVRVTNAGQGTGQVLGIFGGYDSGDDLYWSATKQNLTISVAPGQEASIPICVKPPPRNVCTNIHFSVKTDVGVVSADGRRYCT